MRFIKGHSFQVSIVLAGVCALIPQVSFSENVNSFFEKDAALTVFEKEIKQKDTQQIEMLAPGKKEKAPEQQVKQAPQVEAQPAEASPNNIIAKYGDPSKDKPVMAQESAPEPFKGMLAALDVGDKDLAFQYARQYVRYMHKLDQTTKEAMAYQVLAMEKEGMLSKDDWGKGQFAEQRKLLEKQLEEKTEKQIAMHQKNLDSLDPSVKQFLAEATRAETIDKGVQDDLPVKAALKPDLQPEFDEEAIRREMRAQIAGKVPVDPQGRAEIFFFFRTSDQKSIQMGREFERFYNKNKDDKNSLIRALTIDIEDGGAIAGYRSKNKATFRIENGSVFAKTLGVTKVPSVVAVASTSSQAVLQEGFRNYYFLDELLKAVKGGR